MGIFNRKDKDVTAAHATRSNGSKPLDIGDFTFIRSDTLTTEVIHPPNVASDSSHDDSGARLSKPSGKRSNRLSLDLFRSGGGKDGVDNDNGRSRSGSVVSVSSRLSRRFRLSRNSSSSKAVPDHLPEIVTTPADDGEGDQWERRATMLAQENEKNRSRPGSSCGERGDLTGAVSSQAIDEDIRMAIRLHEEGKLSQSTAMFGRLADPNGPNNPLSQVLYGLALRHGWGCKPDPAAAMTYLSAAASNAAEIEKLALEAGLKKGGIAKGELVLAIFELGNCFRHGWGVHVDPEAAKLYYETAANLDDTDAMNEVAFCYLHGFGTKKDKFAAAKYYRLAEANGNKTLGNSWIWKDKYNPETAKNNTKG